MLNDYIIKLKLDFERKILVNAVVELTSGWSVSCTRFLKLQFDCFSNFLNRDSSTSPRFPLVLFVSVPRP